MSTFKQNENSDKKDLKKIIEDRIKDYELAIEYFKSNDLESQLKKAEEDKQLLIDSLNKVNSGKSSEVNEKTIPKEITPEYINGCSNDERIKKYFEIITKIINEKQKLQTELENEIKELKKLNKNQILSMKEEIQNDFEKIKNKKIKYDEIISILKEDFQNKWIPAPLHSETNENTEVTKINEDVPENTLRVKFGTTDYLKYNKKVFIKAYIKDTNYEETWEQKDAGDWSHVFEWQFDEKEFNEISQKTLSFDVSEKLRNKDKFKAHGDIPLTKLRDNNDYSDDFKFVLETKRTEPVVHIDFKVRKCQIEQKENFIKRIFCFTKFYPAFREEN